MSRVPIKLEEAEEMARHQELVPNIKHEDIAEKSERSMNLDDMQSLDLVSAHNPEPLSNNVTYQASTQPQGQYGFGWTGVIASSDQTYTPAQFGQFEQYTSLPQNYAPAQPAPLGQSDSLGPGSQQNPTLVPYTPRHAPTQGQTALQLDQSSGPSGSGQPPQQPAKTKRMTAQERLNRYLGMSPEQLEMIEERVERDLVMWQEKNAQVQANIEKNKEKLRLMPAYADLLRQLVENPMSQADIEKFQQELMHVFKLKEHLQNSIDVYLVSSIWTERTVEHDTMRVSDDAMDVDPSPGQQLGDTIANEDDDDDVYDDSYLDLVG